MTHEFKDIVDAHLQAKGNQIKTVLATVVALDGSSYRKPGVKMLIREDEKMIGAVSGGCVEKDIVRKSKRVFETGSPIMMTYDGRFRLGCEGILYILIEPFQPSSQLVNAFNTCIVNRDEFNFSSYYSNEEGAISGIGTSVKIYGETYALSPDVHEKHNNTLSIFKERMPASFRLMIFGAEHDAVQLCKLAAFSGWDVAVISGPLETKTIDNFLGATSFYTGSLDANAIRTIDSETAVVIMSHNFANDLKFLIELKDTSPGYLGLLGPAHRREKLLHQLIEYIPDINESFIDRIHGPAGLNIGAETPQEIAISILSEVLSTVRNKTPILLKKKKGGIHA